VWCVCVLCVCVWCFVYVCMVCVWCVLCVFVCILADDLTKLPYLVDLSQRARGVIRQNIFAAILIKFSLAVGVFPGLVSLVIAVLVGDMGASLGVTANAMRLARANLKK